MSVKILTIVVMAVLALTGCSSVCSDYEGNFALETVAQDPDGELIVIYGQQRLSYCASKYDDPDKFAALQLEISLSTGQFTTTTDPSKKKQEFKDDRNLSTIFFGEFWSRCNECVLEVVTLDERTSLRFSTKSAEWSRIDAAYSMPMLISVYEEGVRTHDFIIQNPGFVRVEPEEL